MDILERFLKYVAIDTTSDSAKEDETPSTKNQRKLAEILVDELIDLNLDSIYYDSEHCYVYAKLDGDSNLPSLGFIAHMDTSEDSKGCDIKPNIISNYNGDDVTLNENIIMKVSDNPDLKNHIGKTLITTDGTTLLGADDKAGIAEIMDMLQSLSNADFKHGDIFICFTPDEEIGNGTKYLDKKYFNPKFAYTVDGSTVGEFSYENFNAASATINIKGTVHHLGYAKDKLINAIHIATIINSLLPNEVPENSEKREGYFCLMNISGNLNEANMKFLIRDFDRKNFEKRKNILQSIVEKLNQKYNNCISLDIKDSYYNMLEIIEKDPILISGTKKAIKKTQVEPFILPIRGGTDGCRISYDGIPCPNLGTGGHNFHSVYEYVCLEDMIKTSEILLSIVREFSLENEHKKIKN